MTNKIRKISLTDQEKLLTLFKKSTTVKNGIARTVEEITIEYVSNSLQKATRNGLGIVIEDESGNLIGALLGHKFEPKSFRHTLGNLTMAFDPVYIGQGLGKKIFSEFLREVRENMPEIIRVELNVRRNNPAAIKIYESLGFKLEGIMENRILDADGNLSDDSFMAWTNPNFAGEGL